MKIIDGSGMVLGRLASYAAKESLKKRSRGGSSQKGPKHSRKAEKIVKRTIRGMLPNYREGRGREAWKKIKCYDQIPKELEGKEFIKIKQGTKIKPNKISEFTK